MTRTEVASKMSASSKVATGVAADMATTAYPTIDKYDVRLDWADAWKMLTHL